MNTRRDARGEPCSQASGDRERTVTLTRRQAEVLNLVLEGKEVRRIAAELFVAESTVASHLRALRKRFGVGNRMALCRAALLSQGRAAEDGTDTGLAAAPAGEGQRPCRN